MVEIKMDLLQTIGLAGISLIVGYWVKDRWLKKVTIPAAVIGGLIFAILNTVLYQLKIGYITVDTGLNDFFMVLYFTTIGFNNNRYICTEHYSCGNRQHVWRG